MKTDAYASKRKRLIFLLDVHVVSTLLSYTNVAISFLSTTHSLCVWLGFLNAFSGYLVKTSVKLFILKLKKRKSEYLLVFNPRQAMLLKYNEKNCTSQDLLEKHHQNSFKVIKTRMLTVL